MPTLAFAGRVLGSRWTRFAGRIPISGNPPSGCKTSGAAARVALNLRSSNLCRSLSFFGEAAFFSVFLAAA